MIVEIGQDLKKEYERRISEQLNNITECRYIDKLDVTIGVLTDMLTEVGRYGDIKKQPY